MSTRGVRLFVFITFSEKVITKRAEAPQLLNLKISIDSYLEKVDLSN